MLITEPRRQSTVPAPHQSRKMKRRTTPVLDSLETRTLQTILGVWAYAAPQKLTSNGKYVEILVTGEVTTSRQNQPPTVRYTVIDQYARVQPRGNVSLQMKQPGDYVFNFRVNLQARHSGTFQSARLYSIAIGFQDPDNGAGKTLPVIVPQYYKPPAGPMQATKATKAPKAS